MTTLPQLIEDDIEYLNNTLQDLLQKTDATTALVIDKGGFLITSRGDARNYDLTSIAALASGAYMANQTIANLVHETSFDSVYQQGETHSMFVVSVDEYCLLVVIFKADISVGIVKYYAGPAARKVARCLAVAKERNPDEGLDLSVLNIADTSQFFKKQS
jgi:predicted regulator of Ras-like GTPase activity (Roadblock/LC7/MglB family)